MNLDELYTEVILQYSQDKAYRKPMPDFTVQMRGVNPSCGDDITLSLKIKEDRIADVSIEGTGCAISSASAAMMAELIEGKTLEEAKALSSTFLGMIQKTVSDPAQLKKLEDARALQNISNMPARVKCAVLSWHTLDEAMMKYKGRNEKL